MSQDVQPNQTETTSKIYDLAAAMIRSGMPTHLIEKALIEKGLTPADAKRVVDDLSAANLSQRRDDAERESAQVAMVVGGLICLVGIVVTVATYSAAATSPTGGQYVVAWGAIIFGGWQFIKGLMAYLNY